MTEPRDIPVLSDLATARQHGLETARAMGLTGSAVRAMSVVEFLALLGLTRDARTRRPSLTDAAHAQFVWEGERERLAAEVENAESDAALDQLAGVLQITFDAQQAGRTRVVLTREDVMSLYAARGLDPRAEVLGIDAVRIAP